MIKNCFLKCLGTCIFVLATSSVGAQKQDAKADAFMETYCIRCHNAKKDKGKFRLDNLSRDFGDELVAQDWSEILTRINAGEMPPEEEKQPTAQEVGLIASWISEKINEGLAARMSRRGPVTLYRLSREEYANTVYDLLGVHFDVEAPGAFNEDPRWHGFNRIGSLLSLSPSHVDRYFEAAQKVIADAFPERIPPASTGRVEANDAKAQKWLQENKIKGPVRNLLLPGVTSRSSIHAREAGLYRIRVQLSGLPSFKGRLPHLTIWDSKVKRSLYGQDVIAPEDKPTIVEIETYLPAGRLHLMNEAPGTFEALTLALTRNTPFTHTKERSFTHPSSYKLYKDTGEPIFPMLIVDWVEWEGPILTDANAKKREGLFPQSDEEKEVRACLKEFLERAWRRPAAQSDVERFYNVYQQELEAGEKFRSAYSASLVAVLTAKNFYYIEEGSALEKRERIQDWELASRLSYFLWGSMPDDELFAAARNGTLRKPEVLRSHLKRMLNDEKTNRFLNTFPKQWLQLHKVGMFPPDGDLYPDYDNWLEESMILESTQFFQQVFADNLPILEFLDSDWTVLNARLAMHYGLPQIKKSGFQRVQFNAGNPRGGLLTQASVLSLTSDGVRHRPVHRGVWVWESIFGKSPPPPPPNVEPLEPTPSDKPKATIRDQLEAHATNPNCASCHQKIDPLGFAFDNFNAIGQWRDREVIAEGLGENPKVNASGTLTNGKTFSGPAEFKRRLAEEPDQFAEALTHQLATFALRRVMTIDDLAGIHKIAQTAKKDQYRLRSLIEALVLSDLFQKR